MRNGAQPLQPDLRGGTFDRVNGAEELVDFLRIVVGLERNQAVAYDLQMLFGFRLEKLQNLVWHFIIRRKRVEVGPGWSGGRGFFRLLGFDMRWSLGLRKVERWWLDRERKAIALLERGDVFEIFLTRVADFQKIGFEQRDAVRKKFRQRPMEVFTKRRIERVLKHVRKFTGDFGESWKAVAGGSSAKRVRGNVKPLKIFVLRRNVLQHTHVFSQVLQVLGGFLEEDFDGFAVRSVRRVHTRPSVTSSGLSNSSAVGFRYKMQSFSTIAWNFTGIFEIDSECPRKRYPPGSSVS